MVKQIKAFTGRTTRLTQAGDTIVEVLIAIVVISSVLGGAYAVLNRTTENSQQAREHSQALKVAESQLELLRTKSPLEKQFCFGDTSNNAVMIKETGAPLVTTPGVPQQANGYDDVCKFDDSSVSNRFWVAFTKASDADNTYKVHVTWEGATGGIDKVELAYKVYP